MPNEASIILHESFHDTFKVSQLGITDTAFLMLHETFHNIKVTSE
jgi:hypothetical protein